MERNHVGTHIGGDEGRDLGMGHPKIVKWQCDSHFKVGVEFGHNYLFPFVPNLSKLPYK